LENWKSLVGFSRITLKSQVICWDIYYFSERLRCRLSKLSINLALKSSIVKKMEFLRTLSQKNSNISAQGVRILDSRPVLETSINSIKNFRTHEWDLTTKYSSKKALKLTDAEKHKLSKTLWGEEADRIWLKLVWDTWNHPWTIPDLGFL
jgi:hypothetical protein